MTALTALATLLAAPPVAAAGNPALADVLAAGGIRPVDPPVAAVEFRLPAIAGTQAEVTLSSVRGRWVVLTFFASWCGPCIGEMPTLQALHESAESVDAGGAGGSGLAVLGVSIDDSEESARAFAARFGLTFPVGWDARGEAARAYRASTIPLSYVIDPAGRIVGVSRGARDWSGMGGLLARAAAVAASAEPEPGPDPDATGPAAALPSGGAPIDLPPAFDPPRAEVTVAEAKLRPGRTFHVDVKIHWAGAFEDYLLQPPRVTLPEGIEREGVSASTSTRDGRSVVTYRVALRGEREGEFALDPVEVRYVPLLEGAEQAARVPGPTVTLARPTVAGLSPSAFGAAVAAGAGAMALAGGLVVRARRRGKPPNGGASLDPLEILEKMETLLDEARAHRVRGDPAAALGRLEALRNLDRAAGFRTGPAPAAGAPPVDDGLAEAAEAARYGGRGPDPEILDKLFRRAERRVGELRALRPTPGEVARNRLRLRNPDEQASLTND